MLRIFTRVCALFTLVLSIECDDLPLIPHQGITPDTSPGCADFDTRSWIGVFYEFVGVCWAVVPSLHLVRTCHLSRYFWRFCLDNKVNF